MATIGIFTRQDGAFHGEIRTLTVKAKAVIRPIEKAGDQHPDFRVFAGGVEIGAAWSLTSKAGKPYLSVKLDDPNFAAPIQCRLVESEGGHSLVWNR